MEAEMVDALMEEVDRWEGEERAKGTLKSGEVQNNADKHEGDRHMPVVEEDPNRMSLPLV